VRKGEHFRLSAFGFLTLASLHLSSPLGGNTRTLSPELAELPLLPFVRSSNLIEVLILLHRQRGTLEIITLHSFNDEFGLPFWRRDRQNCVFVPNPVHGN
jgi:hypothetical protein